MLARMACVAKSEAQKVFSGVSLSSKFLFIKKTENIVKIVIVVNVIQEAQCSLSNSRIAFFLQKKRNLQG